MLEAEIILWNGEAIDFITYLSILNNARITDELRAGHDIFKNDVREMRVIRSNVDVLDLEMFENIEYVGFNEGKEHRVGQFMLPPDKKNKLENVPENMTRLICSAYTTITNFDELLKGDILITMDISVV